MRGMGCRGKVPIYPHEFRSRQTRMSLINPRTLNGFRDYLPAVQIPREQLMQTAREVFRSFGFAPIDTPTLEYLEILTGKGSDETCLLYTSPSPRDLSTSRMPSSA